MQSPRLWSASLGAPMPSWDKRHDHRHTLAIFRVALPLGGAGRVRGYVGADRNDRFPRIVAALRGYEGSLHLVHPPNHAITLALIPRTRVVVSRDGRRNCTIFESL